ncbi:MAG: redoxin domain-containing protein [Gemmataceae bacterium]|nr:redoxin domain-containing protein [Gemmataceae bacterium]
MPRRRGVAWALGLIFFSGCADDLPPTITPPVSTSDDWNTVEGGAIRWSELQKNPATVLVFLGLDCPISNAYAPEMIRLHREFSPQGVAWVGIYPDADVKPEDALRHAREYGLRFPLVLDSSRSLARRFGATKMPEAVGLSSSGEVVYRGRIDDRFYDLGKSRGEPQRRDLREALQAVLSGRNPSVSHAPAIGCDIDLTNP